MKPSQLASQLRRIASKIDSSKSPDRTLVARDLKKVLAVVTADQAFIHMNIDLNEHPDLDPDGSSSVAFQNAVESIGDRALSYDVLVFRIEISQQARGYQDLTR